MLTKRMIAVLSLIAIGVVAVALVFLLDPAASQGSAATVTPSASPAAADAAVPDNKAVVLRLIEQGFNGGDADAVREILSDDYVGHLPSNDSFGETLTAEDYIEIVTLLGQAVSRLEVTVEQMVAEGELVATRATLRGEFDVEFYDYPPTGEPLELAFAVFHRFDSEGHIVEEWIAYDTVALEQQFGM